MVTYPAGPEHLNPNIRGPYDTNSAVIELSAESANVETTGVPICVGTPLLPLVDKHLYAPLMLIAPAAVLLLLVFLPNTEIVIS